MIFRRIYDPKLAQASYLIGCAASGEAVVVDPNRDVDQYLRVAEEDGLKIAHVTETHIHADFVSGGRELAQRTGARLYLSDAGGDQWGYRYPPDCPSSPLRDGSTISLGAVRLEALHLPGHTPEHLVFLVTDTGTSSEPMGALTGDFLFVGDVGRPDLLERSVRAGGTMEESARQLFRSLQRFRTLPHYLQVWPGHGAGSACGKSLSAVPQSTLGYELRSNWAFAIDNEAEFVAAVLAGQPDPPRYFTEMKRINRTGPRLLGGFRRPPRLPPDSLDAALERGVVVVDTRPAREYANGAVPGTVNIPRNRSFTNWAGSLLPYDREIQLVVDDQRVEAVDELVRDLAGIGLDRISGYFSHDLIDGRRETPGSSLQTIPLLSLAEVSQQLQENGRLVLDVRSEGEWNAGHVPGSLNVPLGHLEEQLNQIPRNRALIVHCQTGSRAAIAASILRAKGFDQVQEFPGGFAEWEKAGKPVQRGGDPAG